MKIFKSILLSMLICSTSLGFAQKKLTPEDVQKKVETELGRLGKEVDKTNHVWEIAVKDFTDAYTSFIRMASQKEIKREEKKESGKTFFYYTYEIPGGKGELILTDQVMDVKKEVAIMEVKGTFMTNKVQKIRYVKK